MRIFINAGHGGSDSGASGMGLREKDLTLKISKKIVKELKRDYKGFDIKLYRNNDSFKSLNQITNEANRWKADIFVSIHINASGGTGFESYVYDGTIGNETFYNQAVIHNAIMNEIGDYHVKDRGEKRANFAVLRQTKMPALLTENLFIDNKTDADLLKNDQFINDLVDGHVLGIVHATGIEKKKIENSDTGTFYRVVTGSFKGKENAKQRMKMLKEKGFDSFLTKYRK